MTEREVVIVGAGPAGMAAAIAMAEAGLTPTVVDETPQIGGKIYSGPPAAWRDEAKSNGSLLAQRGRQLRARFETNRDKIELLTGTTVWGIFPNRRLALRHDGGWQMIEAQQLVLAPGAYEYVCPFPGWTLPGVMTPGAAQSMVKTMKVLPGKRALVAGSGPFLFVVAQQLHAAGVEVVGVVETARRRDVVRHGHGLLADLRLFREGQRYLRLLKRAGIPIHWGHVVTEARGDEQLGEVVVAPCDQQARPAPSRTKTFEADTLCVGYGFVPRAELAQLAGCRMRYVEHAGGWVPEVDARLETSVDGVWVAGDGGGVAGALVAELEGTLAGSAVACKVGRLDESTFEKRRKPLDRRLAKLRRFAACLDRIYGVRPGLCELAQQDTIVCRCEERTREDVETGIRFGGTDLRSLKVITRLGMGPCRGRMCWPAAARMIARQTGKSPQAIGPASVRPPLAPLSIEDLMHDGPLPASADIAAETSLPQEGA